MGNLESNFDLMRAQFQKASVQVARIEFLTLAGAAIAAKTGVFIEWQEGETVEDLEARLGVEALNMGADFNCMFWEVTKALSMLEENWNKEATGAIGKIVGEN